MWSITNLWQEISASGKMGSSFDRALNAMLKKKCKLDPEAVGTSL